MLNCQSSVHGAGVDSESLSSRRHFLISTKNRKSTVKSNSKPHNQKTFSEDQSSYTLRQRKRSQNSSSKQNWPTKGDSKSAKYYKNQAEEKKITMEDIMKDKKDDVTPMESSRSRTESRLSKPMEVLRQSFSKLGNIKRARKSHMPHNVVQDSLEKGNTLFRRRIDSELYPNLNKENLLQEPIQSPNPSCGLQIAVAKTSSQMISPNSNALPRASIMNSPNERRKSTLYQDSQQSGGQTSNIKASTQNDVKPRTTLFDYYMRMKKTTAYTVVMICALVISTLLDLIRVSFFTSEADIPFFVIMMLLQLILLVNILGRYMLVGFKKQMSSINNIVEILFFINNFFTTYLIKSYTLFLIANYVKIMNITRVSEILFYLNKRWKAKMIEKYLKQREQLKNHNEIQIMRKSTNVMTPSKQQLPMTPLKPGDQIREKYCLNDLPQNYTRQPSQHRSSLFKTSEQSGNYYEQNQILRDRIKDYHGLNMDRDQNQMKLEYTYTSLIIQRTMIIFFLCVISTPFFISSFYSPPHETLDEYFNMMHKSLIYQNYKTLPSAKITMQLEKFVTLAQTFSETPIISYVSPYYNYSVEGQLNLRANEMYTFETDDARIFKATAIFSRRKFNSLQSILGLCAYIWYFILIFVIVYQIKKDIEVQVIIPFNALFEKIWSLIIDPMLVVTNQFQKIAGIYSMLREKQKSKVSQDEVQNGYRRQSTYTGPIKRKQTLKGQANSYLKENIENEIELIDESLFKISKLLMLCYGEAGATVVSKMIKSQSSLLDFSEELGSKTLAIFGFCDIRNFTDVTEILQEGVVSLVNKVAYIVHSNTIKYGGQPNKNIGDAFLLVWKLSSTKESYKNLKPLWKKGAKKQVPEGLMKEATIIADVALLSVLKTISQINTAQELQVYNDNTEMHKRIPGFRIKMGFGLHLGWAIEGMIGSNFKVDASYLSPNVNTAARLEAATKQYGVSLLISEGIQALLSPRYKDATRIVDKAILKGCEHPQEIYTVDIDLFQGEMPILNVAGMGINGGDIVHHTESLHSSTQPSKQLSQDIIRNEKRYIFENLHRGEITTDYLLSRCSEVQSILVASPYFKIFKLQYYQAFRLYLDGYWQEARIEFEKCLRILPGDGPSMVLLEYLEKQDYDSVKAGWKGYRILEDK